MSHEPESHMLRARGRAPGRHVTPGLLAVIVDLGWQVGRLAGRERTMKRHSEMPGLASTATASLLGLFLSRSEAGFHAVVRPDIEDLVTSGT